MENGWNFHGWIALPLEHYAKDYLNANISADEISTGKFVDTMLKILAAAQIEPSQIQEFKNNSKKYAGLSYNRIPNEISETLFNRFKSLIGL